MDSLALISGYASRKSGSNSFRNKISGQSACRMTFTRSLIDLTIDCLRCKSHFSKKSCTISITGLALIVVSRFFLAVPAVLLDDCRVGEAMFRSFKLTRGKWLTLAALLAKSLIGGHVAAMCPFWLASFIHATVPLRSWFPSILTIASIFPARGGMSAIACLHQLSCRT